MSIEGLTITVADPARPAPDGGPSWRRVQAFELLVFLFLIVPSMAFSFAQVRQQGASFDLVAYATILRDLALVALVAFFLWRNREPLTRIGWNPAFLRREAVLGVVLFFPMVLFTGMLERVFRSLGLSAPSTPLPRFLTATDWEEFALALLLVVFVAIAEETIFRGYLILRLQNLTGSPVAAAVLSSVVFAMGHGYEGTAGVATVGVMGLIFAAVYLWRRSLVAPIVMHFLQDFIGIVLLPLLAHK